jgi:hypothetical protein
VYLICILVSGLAATYLAIVHNLLIKYEFTFAIGALAMSFAWFVTAGMALWAIKKRIFFAIRMDDKKLCAYRQFYLIPPDVLWFV